MPPPSVPILKDVVLIGAGHAHVGVLRMMGMNPIPGVRFTLVTREVDTPYSGMLPGVIAGHYTVDEAHIDTGPLARFAGARLYNSDVIGLDTTNKRVMCANRPPVNYDVVSINIGSTPSAQDVPGAAAHAIPVKPIDGFLRRFKAARERILLARGRSSIGVIGGGAGGVELMLSLQRRLMRDVSAAGFDSSALTFTLLTSSDELLPAMPPAVRRRFTRLMATRGITVQTLSKVTALDATGVTIADGSQIAIDEVFWTTRAAPAPWLAQTQLALDPSGFIRVGRTLQAIGHPDVFAVGDVATIDGLDVPKSGVYAVRSAKPLADNIAALIAGRPLRNHRPQSDALYLISTGDAYAVGTRNGVTVEGRWVWRLKDWIDRRFMDRFNTLPQMPQPPVPQLSGIGDQSALKEVSALAMRCGGCGAKVGATVLSRALSAIVPVARDDVVVGLDAPDDAAVVDTGGPRLSVQSVDYFRSLVDDPYIFGKIAANHALGDVFAMGGDPQSALAIATLPYGIESKVEADLRDMMVGANEILREANCALVGGHTSEGAELALGFAINGLINRDCITRKGSLAPGDVLLITKPIGTGLLFAANMRGKARARWIMAALTHMTQSNLAGAAVLRAHGVHASTDVTGFGLLGHLVEMLRASDVDVIIELAQVPLLDGVRETLALAILSSLQPQNQRSQHAVDNIAEARQSPLFEALFDPQTAGGLLAAVPAVRASDCLAALRTAGYSHAAIIGNAVPRRDGAAPITVALSQTPPAQPGQP
jgi:selenide, water dikinase